MPKDYYSILGVAKDASQDEVKKAFRKKAHELHPDKAGGDEAKFKELNEAYQILGNAEKRKTYDQFGESAFSGQGFGGTGMNWEDFVRAARGQGGGGFGGFGSGVQFDFGDLGDIFGDMFGFGGRSRASAGRRTRRGADMEIEMSIDFMEAVEGVERTIRLDRVAICGKCAGNGAEPGTKISTCSHCNGTGQVVSMRATFFGTFQTSASCPVCKGEGKTPEKPCTKCKGEGRVEQSQDVVIKIPAGIDNGQTIRMSGFGNAGAGGSESGDLFVHIRVKPHKRYFREGNDIITMEQVSVAQAALGDNIEVETVHGPISLKIPSGTQPGAKFKLRDKGMPELGGRGRGNHIVIAEVKIPEKLSRQEKKLYEELRDAK